ncbi:MAG: thioredoxin-dependent thiol peroxidase [Bacteroidales bacterium]|jgi:peroxiredoxin Q/BCP|nr:thioredoxin-dependent thiol peroxidase [Bacteroidota bacterium]
MDLLQEGTAAPCFEGTDQDGNRIKLSDFKGKKIVLYFYPKNDTPGCTAESCNLRDNYSRFLSKGYVVIGVNTGSEASHKKFADKYSLPFPIIADTDKKIVTDYGVWQEKRQYGRIYWGIARTTYIIDENGIIESVFKKVDTKNHSEQILGK